MAGQSMTANASSKSMTRQWSGLRYLVMLAAAASVAALIVLLANEAHAAAIILVLLWAAIAIAVVIGSMDEALRSRVAASILTVWFATTPVAWFFIRFPLEKSIVTFERLVFAIIGLLAIGRLVGRQSSAERGVRSGELDTASADRGARHLENALDNRSSKLELSARQAPGETSTERATRFEVAWMLLTVLACLSAVAVSNNAGFALKTAVDAFGLPLIAFYAARTYMNSPRHRRNIVVAAMLLGVFLLGTGAFELVTGINLLPYQGSEILREGELRVNGPFITDSSFAIVSLILALFLRSAPRMFKLEFDASARLLYRAAMAAAVLACLLPLFRAVAIALAVCWAAEGMLAVAPRVRDDGVTPGGREFTGSAPAGPVARFWRSQESRVRSVLTVTIAATLLIFAVSVLAPRNIRDRLISPRNAYGRLLSWRLAANMMFSHPVFGVGLSNYVDYFNREYSGNRSALEVELDTHIVRNPHSNIVWIATELGLTGLALYLAANLFLLIPAWRAIRRGRGRTRAAGACFVVLLAAYWIPGLDLASGMYSELNLYFFFLLGLIFPLLSSPVVGPKPALPE